MSPTNHHRRAFLSQVGMGFPALAAGIMLQRDGIVRGSELSGGNPPPTGMPHIRPRAKSVIWIFLVGGMSQMESFDPKPALNQYAGKSVDETPFKSVLDSPYLKKNLREFMLIRSSTRCRLGTAAAARVVSISATGGPIWGT
jgi:hypothetical protein